MKRSGPVVGLLPTVTSVRAVEGRASARPWRRGSGALQFCASLALAVLASATPAVGETYIWTTGNGVDTNWSNASNWGGVAPSNNEMNVELVFPPLLGDYASHNDLTGLQVTSLSIATQLSSGDYAFTGNAITLSGPAMMANPSSGDPNLLWEIPLALGSDVTLTTSGRQTRILGPINLGSSTLTLDAEGDVVLAGAIGGSGNLVKENSSALTILGANTYTGSTTGRRGALYIGAAAAFGSAATGTTFSGGFLGFVPGSDFVTLESFLFNGGGILAYGTPTMAGEITLDVLTEIETFEASSILTIGGAIGGPAALMKSGPGLLVLEAPIGAYAGGTLVSEGRLQLDTDLISMSPVTVEGGATLSGNGSTDGAIIVNVGGTVAPGVSPGSLASAGLAMAFEATLFAEIEGPNPITQYDRLEVDGPVGLNGATLGVSLAYAPADGEEFTLIAQTGSEAVTGTFANLPEGASLQLGPVNLNVTYQGGTGNDVVLVAGPPNTPTSTPTAVVPTSTATPSASPTPRPGCPTPDQSPACTVTRTWSPRTTATATVTPPATATHTQGATATATPPVCVGDCNGTGMVTINELVLGVNIALGNLNIAICPAFDANGDGQVTIEELIEAVSNALNGCPE